ncbi:MAG: cation diffusion facilitator family transporter [Actinomycetota bacterium]|nr:cation diffusion facilitator family transporter [Actinomycetota bacterium]
MAHGHGHSHPRGADRAATRRALRLTLGLTAAFTVAELVAGVLTGSLALLADAGHMLSDDLSLALAMFAMWLADQPAGPQRTFGHHRAEILAALANGATLVLIAGFVFYEAYRRFDDPPEVVGGWLLVVAIAGLAVNLAGYRLLHRGGGDSLNAQAALRHVAADLMGSLGVLLAGAVIVLTGWRYADPIVSVLIGLLVLGSSVGVLRDSLRILLEAAPRGVDAREVRARMAGADGIQQVHDLHIWTITSGLTALSAHVLVAPHDDCHARRRELERMLARDFGIEHTTLQVDHAHEHGALLQIEKRS